MFPFYSICPFDFLSTISNVQECICDEKHHRIHTHTFLKDNVLRTIFKNNTLKKNLTLLQSHGTKFEITKTESRKCF